MTPPHRRSDRFVKMGKVLSSALERKRSLLGRERLVPKRLVKKTFNSLLNHRREREDLTFPIVGAAVSDDLT